MRAPHVAHEEATNAPVPVMSVNLCVWVSAVPRNPAAFNPKTTAAEILSGSAQFNTIYVKDRGAGPICARNGRAGKPLPPAERALLASSKAGVSPSQSPDSLSLRVSAESLRLRPEKDSDHGLGVTLGLAGGSPRPNQKSQEQPASRPREASTDAQLETRHDGAGHGHAVTVRVHCSTIQVNPAARRRVL